MNDKTFIGVLFVVLVVFLLAKFAPMGSPEQPPADDPTVSHVPEPGSASGPSYLMANTPYMWAPPVGNFLPSIVSGNQPQATTLPAQPTVFTNAGSCGGNC